MKYIEPSKFNFEILNRNLPINIYALRLSDNTKNTTFDIIINHDGYCPIISSERKQSNYNDYLPNLENTIINEYFKINRIKKPKNYSNLFEIVTNSNGELCHYSRTSK
jgi:hypothetical protein